MQGVSVTGMLVWSIYRKEDGPFKCYKSFGDDLNRDTPSMANEKIQNLAISIIRDRIANMSIGDVLQNRHKLRDGVREEIQKLITGWGIWLETIEILDVKIASSTLF
jgi:regulator of protease activity HflC (stomatin/prohibitin superfamily)